MTSNFSFTTKAAVVALSLLTAIAFSGAIVATPTAHGQTVDELQQQIASLLAQIQQLQSQLSGTPSASAYNFTRNLTVGSSGADVTALQNYLISEGFSIPAGATGYFGSQTRSAVAAWQAANGVSPAAGYFGPLSRAKYNELVAASAPDEEDEPPVDEPSDPSTPGLSGGEGYMEVDNLSLSSMDIDLGRTEVIYEVEVEAVDSDIAVNRIDFMFENRPWLYFSEVRLLKNGSEIASLSGSSAFTQISGEWRARFTGLNEVITEGNFAEFSLEVVVPSSMAGTRDKDVFDVWMLMNGIRGVDGSGLVQYAPESGNLDKTEISFSDTFGQGDVTLTIGDNSPESATFVVEENNRTNNQLVVAFTARADNGAVNVTDVTVNKDTGDADWNTMIHRARLYMNGSVISNVAPGADSIVFDDLDRVIADNQTADFEVEVDFRRTSTTGYTSTTTTLEIKDVVVDFEDQDFVSTNETLIVDEEHKVIEEGIVASIVSTSEQTALEDKAGRYTFVLNISAYGDTFRIAEDGSFNATSTGGPGGATTTDATIVSSTATFNAGSGSGWYRINDGQTRQFTVEAFITSVSETELYRVTLVDVEYGTSTATGTSLELGSPEFESGQLLISQ